MEITKNEEEMAKYVKNMSDSDSPKVSTMIVDGKATAPGKETGEALLSAHYPSIKSKQETHYDRNKKKLRAICQKPTSG